MTTYTAIADSEIDPESPGTTTLFTKIRNNPIAITEGATGAPKIATLAMALLTSDSTKHVYVPAQATFSLSNTTTYINAFTVNIPRAGTISVRFTIYTSDITYTTYGRIYVNGSPVGTERTSVSLTPQIFTEDIAVSAGDNVQLYMKQSASGATMYSGGFGVGANEWIDIGGV